MEATIRALVSNLPHERQAHPTVAILGGGGYIGARLVSVLAMPNGKQPRSPPRRHTGKGGCLSKCANVFSLDVVPETEATPCPALTDVAAAAAAADAPDLTVMLGDSDAVTSPGARTTFKQVIALDTRYAGNRHAKSGVLYTAEPADFEAADVVLVITRHGDDAAGYVDHARPGQVSCASPLSAGLSSRVFMLSSECWGSVAV
jgi:hypothetical protein